MMERIVEMREADRTAVNELQETAIQIQEEADTEDIAGTLEQPIGNRAKALTTPRRLSSTADLVKAHIALMEKEVILSKQADLFRLVQHHYFTLQTWHDQHTGWRVQRSSTVIRLVRNPGATTPGYLYERLKDAKDFACLVWALWFAENRQLSGRGNNQQFLLSQLAEQIQQLSAQETEGNTHEVELDFRRQTDRYSIQRALQYLEDMGGLQLVDGQTREWVEQTSDADVLYEFTDVIRSLITALNPQKITLVAERLADASMILQPTQLPKMAETVSDLARAWRALLLGPALLRFDDRDAFAALIAHADAVANELLDTFGWLLDIRRDYACVVRASGMAGGPVTSLTLYGASDHLAVLLCTTMREHVTGGAWPAPDAYGCLHVTTEDIAELLYALRERYGENWGSDARNKSTRGLLQDVYRKMRLLGLLRGPDQAGNILILPTAARFSASYDAPGQKSSSNRRSRQSPSDTTSAIATALPGLG